MKQKVKNDGISVALVTSHQIISQVLLPIMRAYLPITMPEKFHSLNTLEKRDDLRSSLPKEIQLAIKEWAASLSKLSGQDAVL